MIYYLFFNWYIIFSGILNTALWIQEYIQQRIKPSESHYITYLRSRSSSQIRSEDKPKCCFVFRPNQVTVSKNVKLRVEGCRPWVALSLRATTVPPDGFQCLLRDVAGAPALPRRRGPSARWTLIAWRAQPTSPLARSLSVSSEDS